MAINAAFAAMFGKVGVGDTAKMRP